MNVPKVAWKICRFCLLHLILNVINYMVTRMYFIGCHNLDSNMLVSFMYSYIYSSSEYCVALGSMMGHTAYVSKSMWHSGCAAMCLETIGWFKNDNRIKICESLK